MDGTAKATAIIENDRVIVTRYDFAPGANTGWHRHGHDYVVVPLMDGQVRVESADGSQLVEMKAGAPYFRNEGVEHDVINANETDYAFIEIELNSNVERVGALAAASVAIRGDEACRLFQILAHVVVEVGDHPLRIITAGPARCRYRAPRAAVRGRSDSKAMTGDSHTTHDAL